MGETMQKYMIPFFIVVSLSIFSVSLLQKEKTLNQVKNNENIELAIYLNDEETSNIPLKNEGYIFDEEKSSCTNNALVFWDNETWSPVIKNMSEYKTRCTLAFRDYYRVTVADGEDVQIYPISFNDTSISIQASTNHTLLKCNQGVELTNIAENIVINNIRSDVSCSYYDNSLDAINSLDDSENYFIYLQDENIEDEFTVLEGKHLTMDLNGHHLVTTQSIYNYAYLKIDSSSSDYGYFTINDTFRYLVATYEDSELYFNHVELSTLSDVVEVYDNALLTIDNSRLFSSSSINNSTVWLHGGKTTAKIYNSYVEGPYAIGGEGGEILIDSSEIFENSYNGLQINNGYSGNVLILNSSSVIGEVYGIFMYDSGGTLTVGDSDDTEGPVIRGENSLGVYIGTGAVFNYNSGDIYGTSAPRIDGTINVISGKTMTSVDENGVIHTFLE